MCKPLLQPPHAEHEHECVACFFVECTMPGRHRVPDRDDDRQGIVHPDLFGPSHEKRGHLVDRRGRGPPFCSRSTKMRLAIAVPNMELQESQSDQRRHIDDARHRRRPHEDPVARHESKPSCDMLSRHAACKTHVAQFCGPLLSVPLSASEC